MFKRNAQTDLGRVLILAALVAACSSAGQSGTTAGGATAQSTAVGEPSQPAAMAEELTVPTSGPRAGETQPPQGEESGDRARRAAGPTRGREVKPEPLPAQEAGAYRSIEDAVARIRGLKPTRDVELRFMSQGELRQYFLDSFNRDYTPEERARDQKLLTTLGLLSPNQDLTTIMLKVLSEEVIGFYDDDASRMYLIGEVSEPTPASKVTFSHEFTHALQDQYFNLKVLNPPNSDNDDRSAAVQALVEGDATLVMTLYARSELSGEERRQYVQSQSSGGSGPLDEAPLVVRTELLFPYVEGLRFVQMLQRQGGFAAVDAAFRDPPQSTEQILHPEKYFLREAPTAVALPDLASALGDGWRQTTTNTLGELDLRILIEQFSDRPTAERAAAGWAGDHYALLEDAGGRPAVAIKTSWDGAQDAWEFFEAYSRAVRNRIGPQARLLARDPTRQALAGDGYAALVALQDQDVVIVLAPDEAVMNRLAQALAGS